MNKFPGHQGPGPRIRRLAISLEGRKTAAEMPTVWDHLQSALARLDKITNELYPMIGSAFAHGELEMAVHGVRAATSNLRIYEREVVVSHAAEVQRLEAVIGRSLATSAGVAERAAFPQQEREEREALEGAIVSALESWNNHPADDGSLFAAHVADAILAAGYRLPPADLRPQPEALDLPRPGEVCGGCPCEWVTPCSDQCSCAHPSMSGGCLRC